MSQTTLSIGSMHTATNGAIERREIQKFSKKPWKTTESLGKDDVTPEATCKEKLAYITKGCSTAPRFAIESFYLYNQCESVRSAVYIVGLKYNGQVYQRAYSDAPCTEYTNTGDAYD